VPNELSRKFPRYLSGGVKKVKRTGAGRLSWGESSGLFEGNHFFLRSSECSFLQLGAKKQL